MPKTVEIGTAVPKQKTREKGEIFRICSRNCSMRVALTLVGTPQKSPKRFRISEAHNAVIAQGGDCCLPPFAGGGGNYTPDTGPENGCSDHKGEGLSGTVWRGGSGQTRSGPLCPGIPAAQPFAAVFARDRSGGGRKLHPGHGS